MFKAYIYRTNDSVEIPIDGYNEHIYTLVKDKCMVLFPRKLYDSLQSDEKESISNTIHEDMEVNEMINTDVLTVLIDEKFDVYEFIYLVEKVKGSKHQFVIIEGLI